MIPCLIEDNHHHSQQRAPWLVLGLGQVPRGLGHVHVQSERRGLHPAGRAGLQGTEQSGLISSPRRGGGRGPDIDTQVRPLIYCFRLVRVSFPVHYFSFRRHLLGTLNYLDMTRVGVWGWGYGGYVTAMLMGSQQEVFKCGVAVSPIVDWLYYSKRGHFSTQ